VEWFFVGDNVSAICALNDFGDEPAEVAERVGEIVRMLYFSKTRGKRVSKKRAKEAIPRLEPMLERLGVDASHFDAQTLVSLAEHRNEICVAKPRCKQCPLVSFCSTGAEHVKRDPKPVVVDLFAGAGGMGCGFREAGFRVGLAVERDRDAAQTYRFNHPGTVVLERDVRTLTPRLVRRIVGTQPVAICAGPPCQSYSLAGKRKSRDPRHLLFRSVLALARALRPHFVVIENVVGIETPVGTRNFLEIIRKELGRLFLPEVRLLRAVDFGVPQERRRYFFIGRRRGIPEIGVPRSTHKEDGAIGKRPATPTVMESFRRLPHREHGQVKDWSVRRDGQVIWNVGTMYHSPKVVRKIRKIKGSEALLSYRRVSRRYAGTVVAGHRALPVHPTQHRTMSVREAAVLQGFEDDFIFLGSRSNQPLQVANAVPPPVAFAIAKRLRRRLR
jgi:DNA (cytosine-5)-methyltransferase 1